MALRRGTVVILRRNNADYHGMVWRLVCDDVVLLPISGADAGSRHRSEVRIEEFSDFVDCGAPIRMARPVIRCHEAFRWPVHKVLGETGRASDRLIRSVEAAVAREIAARQVEDRMLMFRETETVWDAQVAA